MPRRRRLQPAPNIESVGGGSYAQGDSGIPMNGGGFGPSPGTIWLYANSNRTGAADQLSFLLWTDTAISGVSIPASTNNATGTVYAFIQREDLAWSAPFTLTLTAAAAPGARAAMVVMWRRRGRR